MPDLQESKSLGATNGDTLASHFSAIDALVAEYGLDEEQIWNLDETGCSPSRDAKENARQPCFLRQGIHIDLQIPEFLSTHRVTIWPAVSPDGDTGPVLFVFKRAQMP